METSTKAIPLKFNKVFLLSLTKPSKEAAFSSSMRMNCSFDNESDMLNYIEKDMPPLLSEETSDVFWLSPALCEELELFEELYPYSKFILIYNEEFGLEHDFHKKVLDYFQVPAERTMKYNDIILALHHPEANSNKFITFNEDMSDKQKVVDFLLKSISF